MTALPLLQIVDSPANTPELQINGFSTRWLVGAQAGPRQTALGIPGTLKQYRIIHPYFLRAQGNRLLVEGARGGAGSPAGELDLRVVRLDHVPGQEAGTEFACHELLHLSQHISPPAAGEPAIYQLQGSFDWPGLPDWRWTQDAPIADTPAHRDSLRAALDAAWAHVDRMGGGNVDAAWVDAARASTREFIQASEQGGRIDHTLDTLVSVASSLKLAGDDSPEVFVQKQEAAAQARVGRPDNRNDAPAPHIAVKRLPDGRLPPRLSLRPLGSFGELRLQLLGEGRLARLTDRQGSPVLQFISNYRDGSRGAPDTLRYSADLWFRLNGQQQWELAAIYPSDRIGGPRVNPWLDHLVQGLPY